MYPDVVLIAIEVQKKENEKKRNNGLKSPF